jgi:hypothetical protein
MQLFLKGKEGHVYLIKFENDSAVFSITKLSLRLSTTNNFGKEI